MEYCWLYKAAKSGDKEKIKESIPIMDKYMKKRLVLFDGIPNNEPERLNPEDRDYCNCNYCNRLFLITVREFIDKMIQEPSAICDSLNSMET